MLLEFVVVIVIARRDLFGISQQFMSLVSTLANSWMARFLAMWSLLVSFWAICNMYLGILKRFHVDWPTTQLSTRHLADTSIYQPEIENIGWGKNRKYKIKIFDIFNFNFFLLPEGGTSVSTFFVLF